MSVKLGSNIASIISQRKLGEATGTLSKVYERLSSGQRINHASDDAAGLAIADSLNAKARIFSQAIRNGNDGISYLNIADSAIAELSGIVVRIRELSEQSANGSYSNQQRKALDAEAQALSKEFTRITQTTSFNSIKVFSAEGGNVLLQLGDGDKSTLNASIGGAIGSGRFGDAVSYSNDYVNSVTLGDLNGDGILDMVTAGYRGAAGEAVVRLGLGDRSFGLATSYATEGNGSSAIYLGDLNGDNILDMVTAGADGVSGKATVRLGLGDGSFGAATSYTAEGQYSSALYLGDLNGDNILDMVTAGRDGVSGKETIRFGLGNGQFGEATSYSVGGSRSALNFGDLNGDGILDMVSTGYGNGEVGNSTIIRLGLGDGTFGAATIYSTPGVYKPNAVMLGDLNNDGKLDLITADYGAYNGHVTIRLGKGDGTFGSYLSYTADDRNSYGLQLGDLNQDGILDIATTGHYGDGSIWLGSGDGTFAERIIISSGPSGGKLKLGDLDGDGVLDMVVAGNGVEARLASTTAGLGAMQQFSLQTRTDALQSMSMLDKTLQNLAKQRGSIGASLSRVEVAISNLTSAKENFKAAESRIRDTDIASDAAELVRTQILQQAASSVLAQANQAPTLALKLLQ